MDQLSSIDASFLHLETPETPMHVGSLMLFELPEGYQGDYYEDVKAMLGKRLHLASVLTRKLAQMPFELAEPVWIEDDDIDLDYHVRSVIAAPPRDDAAARGADRAAALHAARPQSAFVGDVRHRRPRERTGRFLHQGAS